MDRLLSKYPEYRQRVVFVQTGPESRSHIKRYQELNEKIVNLVKKINWRHGSEGWAPIVFIRQHLALPQILALYHLADVCVVSALHDGMNLVAKEYIAAKNVNDGVLVLSQFTGAARELSQALLINPYDTESFADTLAIALNMDTGERANRLRALRETVEKNNIYRWAGKVFTIFDSLHGLSEVSPQEMETMLPLTHPLTPNGF